MDELISRMGAQRDYEQPGQAAAEPGPGGAGLDIMARLAVAIEGFNRNAARPPEYAKPVIPYDAAHIIPIPAVANNAAGTIDIPNQQRPMQGYVWHIGRLTVVFGSGTTSVSIYGEAADNSTLIVQFTASGIFEPSRTFLTETHRLVYVSAGGGFTCNGEAIQVKLPWLATYLM